MYATPNPTVPFIEVSLIFSERGSQRAIPKAIRIFLGENEISDLLWIDYSFQVFSTETAGEMDYPKIILPPPGWMHRFQGDIQNIQMFQSKSALLDLVRLWRSNLPFDRPMQYGDVVISHRRLNIFKGILYSNNFVYRVQEGRILRRWKISTDTHSLIDGLEN